jgi:hypothetical protein
VLRARKGFVGVARVISCVIYFCVSVVVFGANPSAGFTQWAYGNLDRVMEPFRGIFTPIRLGTTSGNVDAVFDTSVVFAMIVYGIVAMVLRALTMGLSQRLQYLDAAEADAERREQQERAAADMQAASLAPSATDTATNPPISGVPSA